MEIFSDVLFDCLICSIMPQKCCVPNCKGNYASEKEKVSVFQYPSSSDEERRRQCNGLKIFLEKVLKNNTAV